MAMEKATVIVLAQELFEQVSDRAAFGPRSAQRQGLCKKPRLDLLIAPIRRQRPTQTALGDLGQAKVLFEPEAQNFSNLTHG